MGDEENLRARRKAFLYTFITFLVLMTATQWYATYSVAADCNYNPVLDWGKTIGEYHIYAPWAYYAWSNNESLQKAIPHILDSYSYYSTIVFLFSMLLLYFLNKSMQVKTSHGTASFATKSDINKSDLGEYESKNGGVYNYTKAPMISLLGHPVLKKWTKKKKIIKKSGVVVGINPFTHKLMLHDGVEHILLMAPTRSGKGVCTIVPTGLIWKHSIFFFDPKGELWSLTSGYRKNFLHQKVLKFQPLCTDGSGARWNPLAEINYRTTEELIDTQSIVSVMVRPDGEQKGGDSFWPDSAAALLNGVILHLLYKHDKEGLPLPCPTDIMSFLSSPGKSTEELFTGMRDYPHITVEEFLELPKKDENGNILKDENGIEIHYKNPFKEIYGEYIKDFSPFVREFGCPIKSIDEIRIMILHKMKLKEKIEWGTVDENGMPNRKPYHFLLTHPKVAETASNMLNGAEQTRASIMQTAQTSLAIYQDPVVQSNMAVSDFAIRDLLDPQQEVSLYLVMEVKDIQTVKPIARLFIQLLCSKLIRDMKFETDPKKPKPKKQRLLLMLDEFPQLGNMKCIELALAICAGYGIKMCIVCQDVNQLNKEYTKDNSIGSNCHLHIYFTPNIDSGGATAEAISKTLGKKTIDSVSHSDGGGGFAKGSNSISQTGRELMTPDEVSHMSGEKELVFVAGHKAIYGDKLRYYQVPWLLKRTQVVRPAISDHVTRVTTYDELFHVHAADATAKEDDRKTVLAAKAQELGYTYKDYMQLLEKERKAREAQIYKAITGEEPDDGETHNEGQKHEQAPQTHDDGQGTDGSDTPEITLDPDLENEGIGEDLDDNFEDVFGGGHGGLPQQGNSGESDGGLAGAQERLSNRQKERKEAMQGGSSSGASKGDELLGDFDESDTAEEEQEPTDAGVEEPDEEPEPDESVQEPEEPEDTASQKEASPLDSLHLGDVGDIIKNGMEKKKNQSNE